MKIKRSVISLLLTAVLALGFILPCFAANITEAKTPRNAAETELKWSKKLGTNYTNAPSVITIVNDTAIVMSGKTLLKLNAQNGETIAQAQMVSAPSYGTVSVTYAEGVLYCPLGGGQIQAFDFETLNSLWVYKDELGGQALTPITYDNGCIYTGFWKNEDKEANYVCIDVTDENAMETHETKFAKWVYKNLGGFYWAGAAVVGNYIVFGCDDGTDEYTNPSKVLSVNKATGEVIESLEIIGDQRSSITEHKGKLFFSTKAGFLYSVSLTENGKFDCSSLKKINLGGSATAAPVIYNERLYIGVQGSALGSGRMLVLNSDTLKTIYAADMKGYPQNAVLISNAYESETGQVYIYSTYNSYPGGITVLTDSPNQTSAKIEELFVPEDEMAQYSISTIAASEDGTLYYKNDSGYIFAVGTKTKNDNFFVRLFVSIANFFAKVISIFTGFLK